MRIRTLLSVAIAAAVLSLLGVPTRAEEPDLVESIHKETAALAESVAAKRQAVAEAITAAAKAKLLKPSTEASYRKALAKLSKVEDPTNPEPAYFPPRLEPAEKYEPINFAWTDLKDTMRREFVRSSELSRELRAAAGGALQAAAREGTKGADLDVADRLINASRNNVSARRHPSYFGSSQPALQQLSRSMRAILDAARRQDVPALEKAFAAYGAGETRWELPSMIMPVDPRLVMAELRARVSAPFVADAQAAQRKVEAALLRDAPGDEVGKAIVEFDAAYSTAERLSGKERPQISAAYADQPTPVAVYRAAMLFQDWLKNENAPEDGPSFPTVPPQGTSWVSAEFQNHIAKLRACHSERRRFLSCRAEEKRVLAEREKQQEAAKRKRASIETATAELRPKFEALRNPEQAVLLADSVEAAQSRVEGLEWSGLSEQLRAIARWWLNRDPHAAVPREAILSDANNHPFVLEMRALRGRAARAVAIQQLKLAQLEEAEVAQMDTFEALQKIADDAAERGDWKKSYEVLVFLSTWAGGSANARRERIEAIRAFLAARNLEDADQPRQAAYGYLSVIQSVGEHLPLKEAGERLKKLQSEHPELKKDPSGFTHGIEGEASQRVLR